MNSDEDKTQGKWEEQRSRNEEAREVTEEMVSQSIGDCQVSKGLGIRKRQMEERRRMTIAKDGSK